MALTRTEFERIKANLTKGARFDRETVDNQIEKSFDNRVQPQTVEDGSLAKDRGGKSSTPINRSKPGIVTREMNFKHSRSELGEDGGKRWQAAASDGLPVTQPDKKWNGSGSDILLVEWDHANDRLCLRSIDVKAIQIDKVYNVEAHENAHLEKSLRKYQDGYEKRLRAEFYPDGDERILAMAMVEMLKEIRADIPAAKKSKLLKLSVDNTGGNAQQFGRNVDPETELTDHLRQDDQGNVKTINFDNEPKVPAPMRAAVIHPSTETSTDVSPAALAQLKIPTPSSPDSPVAGAVTTEVSAAALAQLKTPTPSLPASPAAGAVTTEVSAAALANLKLPSLAGTPSTPPAAPATSPVSPTLPKGFGSPLSDSQTPT